MFGDIGDQMWWKRRCYSDDSRACQYLSQIIPVEAFGEVTGAGSALLIGILQNMPMLETLIYTSTQFRNEEEYRIVDGLTPIQCRIKTLEIEPICNGYARDTLGSIDRFVDFVLQSCPLLENLNLIAFLPLHPGAFHLRLLNHTRLKHITANFPTCSYFILNKTATRCKTYDDDHKVEANRYQHHQQDAKTHVNLDCPQGLTRINFNPRNV